MSKLIAEVPTAVIVNGVREVIPAGQPLPDLGEHDSQALLLSGAASDPAAARADAKREAAAEAQAQAEFQAARESVQAAQASTEVKEAAATKAGKAKS